MAIECKVDRQKRTITIYKNGREFTSGTVYSNNHAKAIDKRFKAWDAQGWPYKPKDV